MTEFYYLNMKHLERALDEENLHFEKEEKTQYMKYFTYISGKEKKTCNVNRGGKRDGWIYLFFEEAFNLANKSIFSDFEPITEEEARIKHYGLAKAVYKGHDHMVIKKLVKSMKNWLHIRS
ncbi:MAG: hypothetical protein A4E52_00135 [Pelotomaculum sp. PtaB.Bin013]|uniref:Uncharacterized protein n=1 Tax=Pelotomaculum isophthalicicum JI TaxID=947010 RepID=A0A9X4JW00_9FIRM|nr:hypothetical protein [Pelotomaculum isophthalicicum]MDF9408248.1 hypothetical protein [Pelotomaculum isophthalicicum JI]OPX92133.1 MAG: hypothetical protein A4E52_00135 [Pelotomaculum sp. PtaB.Bin013]